MPTKPEIARAIAATIATTAAIADPDIHSAIFPPQTAQVRPGEQPSLQQHGINISHEPFPFPIDARTAEAAPNIGTSIPGGAFYTETNGGAGPGKGYRVTGTMWEKYNQFGGDSVWGPPVSRQYVDEVGRTSQAFQRGIFQVNPQTGAVEWANIFDQLSEKGKDQWLLEAKQTPNPEKWNDPQGWDAVVAHRQSALDQFPAIRAAYSNSPQPIDMFGLPVTHAIDMGNHYALRAQRAVFQQWKEDVPWAKKGQVTVALGGDIAKEAGLIPASAVVLESASSASQPPAPIETPKPTIEFPPILGGYRFKDNPTLRDQVLNFITWAFIERRGEKDYVAASGKYISSKKEGDKIIIKVTTNKDNPNEAHEVSIEPRQREGLRFVNTELKPFYQTSDPDTAFEAVNHYITPGDPIQVVRYFKGNSTQPHMFSTQQIQIHG